MGLNIIVKDFSKVDKYGCPIYVPEWDYIRCSGDRDITGVLVAFGVERHTQEQDDDYFRPLDFSNLIIAVKAFENHIGVNNGRWVGLIKLLEENPTYWVYFSY